MAMFRGHITTSTALGVAYGLGGWYFWQQRAGVPLDWGPACLAGGLTALGGMLPDLDSDSGVPIREMSSLAAVVTPLLLLPHLGQFYAAPERLLVVLALAYLLIRYGVAEVFKRCTVHRGMFHSIPAMLIAGLVVLLLDHSPNRPLRLYLAGGTMLGFLSHLVLDEICAVDLHGLVPRLNKCAGSALKLFSPSWSATLATYLVLFSLAYTVWVTL